MKRNSVAVQIGNIWIGAKYPVNIQTMTDTSTADVQATVKQIEQLIDSGAELVRVTIPDPASAKAIPEIKELLQKKYAHIPLIGDFHFVGHRLLKEYPECASSLDKYRINPGNLGRGKSHDANFAEIIEIAIKNKKAVRIGVNAGSLDEELMTELMEKNHLLSTPLSDREVLRQAMVESALRSSKFALELGLPKEKLVLSVKTSDVSDTIWCYRTLAKKTDLALHLGLTEAGSGNKGIIASTAALSVLLSEGIGDTIRISLTPTPGTSRTREVEVAKLLLQSLGLRHFAPTITSCPGCGRTTSEKYQKLAQSINSSIEERQKKWKKKFPGSEQVRIAVMGCVVNGPGESRQADIGISLPGKEEGFGAVVYVNGKKHSVVQEPNIAGQFCEILEKYLENRFKNR
jgi:(E)-4-hydroxy-3-methylbut-2-enyl-diphosphate synthase